MTAPNPQHGTLALGDALVTHTADMVDLAALWNELNEVFALANEHRTNIARLLSWPTTDTATVVPQNVNPPEFEIASEFGVPKAVGMPADTLLMGYMFRDYDVSSRASWRFIRSASADQVRAIMNSVIEADDRLVNGNILYRLFNPNLEHNEWNQPCWPLWNADGNVPPPWLGNTFDSTHTHMLSSMNDEIDSDDLESGFHHIREHGYGLKETGGQLVVFCNYQESQQIQSFRANEPSRSGTTPPDARFTFVPSIASPPYLSPDFLIGTPAPAQFNGLDVVGSYGPSFIIETQYIPAGYLAIVATAGPDALTNPIGVRHHINQNYQGLRLIPGPDTRYPLTESFSARAFGVGTRHRGAALVYQITSDPDYTAPPKTAFGIR
jgi:hypothetical protein